jgi:hypothetical protein
MVLDIGNCALDRREIGYPHRRRWQIERSFQGGRSNRFRHEELGIARLLLDRTGERHDWFGFLLTGRRAF